MRLGRRTLAQLLGILLLVFLASIVGGSMHPESLPPDQPRGAIVGHAFYFFGPPQGALAATHQQYFFALHDLVAAPRTIALAYAIGTLLLLFLATSRERWSLTAPLTLAVTPLWLLFATSPTHEHASFAWLLAPSCPDSTP